METHQNFTDNLVSIIVPVYNVENYLNKCLTSLIEQSFENFEVILINDGSTDNGGKICDAFVERDKRFHVLHTENNGVSHARNLGIDLSKGKYIVFVDSDDWAEPSFLNDFIKKIPTDNDDFLILQNAIDSFENNDVNKFNFRNQKYRLDKDFFTLFHNEQDFEYGYPWNKFFVRDIIISNNLKFDIDKQLFEDEEFYYNYLKYINNVVTVDTNNYHYVSRPNSAIKKAWIIDHYLMKLNMKIDLFNFFLEKKYINEKQFDELCSKYFNNVIYSLYKEHIYNKEGNDRISNMKKLSPALRKLLKYSNLNNKRIMFVLKLIGMKQYRLSSFLINKIN